MRRITVIALVIALASVAGCGSKSSDAGASQGSSSATATGDEPKAIARERKAASGLEEQLIAPPPEVTDGLGADAYPGARIMKSLKGIRSEVNGVHIDYVFFVKDEPRKVRDFYKARLVDATNGDDMMEKIGAFVVKGKSAKGEEVVIQARGAGEMTTFHYVVTKKS